MLKSLATIIFYIPPSQVENERDLFLDGIFTSYSHANLSIDIPGNLLFININSHHRKPTPKTSPDILSAPSDLIQDIAEDT